MTPRQGVWVHDDAGYWEEVVTGFRSMVDPAYAPPDIDLPRFGDGEDYNRWQTERDARRQALGTYVTVADVAAGVPVPGADVDVRPEAYVDMIESARVDAGAARLNQNTVGGGRNVVACGEWTVDSPHRANCFAGESDGARNG